MLGRWLFSSTAIAVTLAGGLAVPATAQSTSVQAAAVNSSATSDRALNRRPSAIVSLGDSYIAGEGARWKGNSADATAGYQGTDRGVQVYGDTDANGCHRSDVAEIISARLPVRKSINLACSGARTVNVLRASAGGVAFKGEAPQNDQLATVAKDNNVKLVVLSIGGNDFGFGKIVTDCVVAYFYSTAPCKTQEAAILAALPTVTAAVAATLADVRATMSAAGYQTRDYRLVLQSYPAFAPAGEARYSGTAPDARASIGGCPFLDADVAWSRQTLTPALSDALAGVARKAGVQFLDLTDAFRGHELCAASAKQSTGNPRSAASEWFRFVDLNGQGSSSESLHPNYFGQKALGRCLALTVLTRKDVACHGIPGRSYKAVYLTKSR
jgi:lysophospholipase L1-like esterase